MYKNKKTFKDVETWVKPWTEQYLKSTIHWIVEICIHKLKTYKDVETCY
jgi:hypothetical protein